MERRKVTTPKEFFVSERDRSYSDWLLSFWRELFQNSTDAGAKRIDISVETTEPRGSFDDPAPSLENVTRIVFSDDGCGMTETVLNEVYFSIGATTKQGGDSIGGYGRARLMTCFANLRYSILTTDRFVMGDGADWVNFDLQQGLNEISAAEVKLLSEPEGPAISRAISGLAEDRRLLSEAMSGGGHKGCRIEVDVDPASGRYSTRPTKDFMLSKLKEYLSESQLSPKVFINGKTPEEFFETNGKKLQARRGAVRRKLSVPTDEGTAVFADVHLNESDNASHKRKVIVRVNGASMFTEFVDADAQVIIELDPHTARDAMTSNRDGLRGDYRRALQDLLQKIAVDNESALKEKKAQRIKIDGERGHIRARHQDFSKLAEATVSAAEIESAQGIGRTARSSMSSAFLLAESGLPIEVVEQFMRALRKGNSLLDGIDNEFRFRDEFAILRERTAAADWGDEVDLFFSVLSAEARTWLANVLKERIQKDRNEVRAADERLSDLNDVVIHVENTNPSIRSAMRRNDPRNWDVSSGRGRQPRSLLAAWTEACRFAVDALLRVRPSTFEFDWTTGWCYDVAKEKNQGDRTRDYVTKALCIYGDDGNYAFLLNPVTQEGKLAFNPSRPEDRQKIQALAIHEISHVVEDYHNETYAGILTDILEVYDFRGANTAMKRASKAVQEAYDRGKAVIQPMDYEPGVRPSDKLLETVAPNAFADGSIAEAIAINADGTREVDCDALEEVERRAALERQASPSYRFEFA